MSQTYFGNIIQGLRCQCLCLGTIEPNTTIKVVEENRRKWFGHLMQATLISTMYQTVDQKSSIRIGSALRKEKTRQRKTNMAEKYASTPDRRWCRLR